MMNKTYDSHASRYRSAVFLTGTCLTAVLLCMVAYFTLLSPDREVILCVWGQSCDGGDLPFAYRAINGGLLLINLPVYALGLLLPRADSVPLYVAWCALMFLGGAGWWFLIGILTRRWARRVPVSVIGVLIAFGLAIVSGAFLALWLSRAASVP